MPAQLVSTADVRAVLGVSAKELTDAVLTRSIFSVRLREDMLEMHSQLVADFATIGSLDTRTDIQERFVELASAYAAYHVANQCLAALPMFSFQSILEEKAEYVRATDPFKLLRQDVQAVLAVMKRRLQAAYAAVNPSAPVTSAAARTLVVSVGLASDPVLGT
jgi:methionyl-tRNA synthetase